MGWEDTKSIDEAIEDRVRVLEEELRNTYL